jgi:hypothetical protein
MGRPIKKRLFGTDNVNDGLVYNEAGGEGVASVTTTTAGSLYSKGISATVANSPIGGTRATISSLTTNGSGALLVATVGTAGSGYITAPAITIVKPANVTVVGGTINGSTMVVSTVVGLFIGMTANAAFNSSTTITAIYTANTSVLMSAGNTAPVTGTVISFGDSGTSGVLTAVLAATTTSANTIQANAWVTGGTIGKVADIVSQRSSRRYKVTNADGTSTARLVPTLLNLPTVAQVVAAGGPTADGEMTLMATDSAGGLYLVGKLESNTALLFPAAIGGAAGSQFAANSHVEWTSTGSAVENVSVKLASND